MQKICIVVQLCSTFTSSSSTLRQTTMKEGTEPTEKDFTDEFGCVDHSAYNIAVNRWHNIVKDEIQDRIESNIKDAAHWLGSWSALRELIDTLEDNEKEKAYENPKY